MPSHSARPLLNVVRLGSLNLSSACAVDGLQGLVAVKHTSFVVKDCKPKPGKEQFADQSELGFIDRYHYCYMDDISHTWLSLSERSPPRSLDDQIIGQSAPQFQKVVSYYQIGLNYSV